MCLPSFGDRCLVLNVTTRLFPEYWTCTYFFRREKKFITLYLNELFSSIYSTFGNSCSFSYSCMYIYHTRLADTILCRTITPTPSSYYSITPET